MTGLKPQFYTTIDGRPYPGYEYQDYKDEGFNTKFRLKKESSYPGIAVGFNDIAGTGIYSSEYIVGSYGIDHIDLHLGIGWGRMNGGSFHLKNPLRHLSDSFLDRCITMGCDEESPQGGTLRLTDYFSGHLS